jgi:hypothetical protein
MFNELSISPLESVSLARNILEIFVKSSIKAKEYGFTEIRLNEGSLKSLYQLNLFDDYRIDHWLHDKEVNPDLQDSFRDIISTSPLIKIEELSDNELYERSEFFKELDDKSFRVFGLGAAFVYGTLSVSLQTHMEWLNSVVSISHYSLDHDGTEITRNIEVKHFSSNDVLVTHKKWIEKEQKESLEKCIDLWINREKYFPNLLFGRELKNQIEKIGLTKSFDQIFDCLKKLDEIAKTWNSGGFELHKVKSQSMMNISGESASTMQRFSVERKFQLSNGEKKLFELHIKIPDFRIYFWPDEKTHEITIGYIGKHLRTSLFN